MPVTDIEDIKERLRKDNPEEYRKFEEYFEKMGKETKEFFIERIRLKDLFMVHCTMDELSEEEILKLLHFTTADSNGLTAGRYHWNYSRSERFTNEGLEPHIKDGSVIKFPKPIQITKYGQMPYLDSKGIIHIIDHEKLEHKVSCWNDLEARAVYDSIRGISLI